MSRGANLNYTAILQDLLSKHTSVRSGGDSSVKSPSNKLTNTERKIWTDIKNLHDLTQQEQSMSLEHRFTLSQKVAFQLEEQL